MTTVNITPIINAVIALICAVLTTFLIPWIKTNIAADKLKQVTEMIRIAVTAAEQLAATNGWDGEAKKEYVKECLIAKGIEIDSSIDNTIEALVYELHNALVEEE